MPSGKLFGTISWKNEATIIDSNVISISDWMNFGWEISVTGWISIDLEVGVSYD